MIGTFLCKTQQHLSWGFRVSSTHKQLYFLESNSSFFSLKYISSVSNQQHSFTVSYLINSCGLSPESALPASKGVNFETPEKPDSVLTFLNNHGFSKTHISNLIRRFPRVLLSNPDKTLLLKFSFFYSKGFSSLELADTLSSNPEWLKRSLEKHLIPSYEFLNNFLQSDKKTLTALKCSFGIQLPHYHKYIAPNIDVLVDNGVPRSNIMVLLTYHPSVCRTTCDKFKEIVEEVKKMGFDPLRLQFVTAIQLLRSMSKLRWQRKVEVYKRWGWSEEETLQAFRKYPWCMGFSEDKITASMNFYVNKMGWESSVIARRPQLVSVSLDRRIVPRCSILQVLLSRGLVKKDVSLRILLESPEKTFLQKFVTCYKDESPQLLKLYQEKMSLAK